MQLTFDHAFQGDGTDVFSANAQHIFKEHYYLRDARGELIEATPREVIGRVCEFFNQRGGQLYGGLIARTVGRMYDAQMGKLVSFNSPVYYNANPNSKKAPLLFACFLGDLRDSIDSIGDHVKRFMKIFKYGAGIGVNVGNLRPRGASLGDGGMHYAGKVGSSGAVSFMKLYNVSGEIVKSAGKRRAAIMIMIDDSHPDVEEFIECKSGPERHYYENMNISVAVTDAFMRAVDENKDWDLKFGGRVWKTIRARDLWAKFIDHAHRSGDPGIFFIDRANQYNAASMVGPIRCTNPCGEVSLPPSNACNLAAINLYQVALEQEPKSEWGEGDDKGRRRLWIDNIISRVNELATLTFPFQDALATLSGYPDDAFREQTQAVRSIGLGIKGFGQMLYVLRMRYGSQESQQLATRVMEEVTLSGLEWSTSLDAELSTPLLKDHEDTVARVFEAIAEQGTTRNQMRWRQCIGRIRNGHLRNLFVSTIAPTGNTGVVMDAYSGGMEPIFSLAYTRNLATGGTMTIGNPSFEKAVMDFVNSFDGPDPHELRDTADYIISEVAAAGGRLTDEIYERFKAKVGPSLPAWWREIFVVANDIDPIERVDVQAAFQCTTSLSISGTTNLPNDTPVETIGEIYMHAWKQGCKGITVFRDGCLSYTPLETAQTHADGNKNKIGSDRSTKVTPYAQLEISASEVGWRHDPSKARFVHEASGLLMSEQCLRDLIGEVPDDQVLGAGLTVLKLFARPDLPTVLPQTAPTT